MTQAEIDLHLEKWSQFVRQFGLEAFDRALNQCIDESPFWPDPADIRKRIVDAATATLADGELSDNNDAYWRDFRADQVRIQAWKESPEYAADMGELQERAKQLDSEMAEITRRRKARFAGLLQERARLIPTLPPEQEKAILQKFIDQHEARRAEGK